MTDEHACSSFLKRLEPTATAFASDDEIENIVRNVDRSLSDGSPIFQKDSGNASAPMDLQGALTTIAALAVTAKLVWEFLAATYKIGKSFAKFLEDADKIIALSVDDNIKLKLAETVIARLRDIGLQSAAGQVEGWVDKILDDLTMPPN